jgi:serine/threonine protein kinase
MTTTIDPDVQEIIGDYELLAKLGEGGMGTVYKGRHRLSGQLVAIKRVPPEAMANQTLSKRFEQEFTAAKALDHPNIVRALDYWATEDEAILVMEYVDGESLGAKLERDGPLPETQAILLITQVAQGLHHAHQRGLIHRDVKPDNILINLAGQAKLTDLGLAKDLEAATNLTHTGRALGTPHYMAPEQFRNAKAANVRSDVFSLAATLYTMVTGQLPFKGNGLLATFLKMAKNDLISPRKLVPTLSKRVDGVIRKALEAEPELRPASCRQFLEELLGQETTVPAEAAADLDVWYVEYRDEHGAVYSDVGSTQDVRRFLKDRRLGDPAKVRVGRTREGLNHHPWSLSEFQDLAPATPAPSQPAKDPAAGPDLSAGRGVPTVEPTIPVPGAKVSCPNASPDAGSASAAGREWLGWLALVVLGLATTVLAGLFLFPAK